MDEDSKIRFFVDWREDEKSSLEVDRALYLREYFGIFRGVRYLIYKGFAFRIVFRVLITGRRRAEKHIYLPISRDDGHAENMQRLR
ncbi:MAG: hypothetical protein AB1807_23100 [Pseudomonadota bacterium]